MSTLILLFKRFYKVVNQIKCLQIIIKKSLVFLSLHAILQT
jgi:hypothetical protein